MNKRKTTILAAAAVMLAMVFAAKMQSGGDVLQVEAIPAKCEDIYNSISVSGTVETVHAQKIALSQFAVAAEIYADRGVVVQKGDPLFRVKYKMVDPEAFDTLTKMTEQDIASAAFEGAQDNEVFYAERAGMVMRLPHSNEQLYPGIICAEVADLNTLQLRAKIPELYVAGVEVGQTANFHINAMPEQVYSARVSEIAPCAVSGMDLMGKKKNPTVETLLTVTNANDELRPGYSADIKIFTDHHPYAVTVPYEAVLQEGKQEVVYRVVDGKLKKTPVKTGYFLSQGIEIRQGVRAGEMVALQGADVLEDGRSVSIGRQK